NDLENALHEILRLPANDENYADKVVHIGRQPLGSRAPSTSSPVTSEPSPSASCDWSCAAYGATRHRSSTLTVVRRHHRRRMERPRRDGKRPRRHALNADLNLISA